MGRPPDSVRKVRVASFYYYVSLIKQRHKHLNEVVNRLACLDHQHHLPGPAEV